MATDKAIEVAARAKLRHNWPGLSDADIEEMLPDHIAETTAAVITYLRNVKAGEAVVEAGGIAISGRADIAPRGLDVAFKAMCAAKADELEEGRE